MLRFCGQNMTSRFASSRWMWNKPGRRTRISHGALNCEKFSLSNSTTLPLDDFYVWSINQPSDQSTNQQINQSISAVTTMKVDGNGSPTMSLVLPVHSDRLLYIHLLVWCAHFCQSITCSPALDVCLGFYKTVISFNVSFLISSIISHLILSLSRISVFDCFCIHEIHTILLYIHIQSSTFTWLWSLLSHDCGLYFHMIMFSTFTWLWIRR